MAGNMKLTFISASVVIMLVILAGCLNTSGSEINSCINDEDSKAEKDCFMNLVCKNQDFNLCEDMPDDTNARQGNKGFCLAFVTSMTNDLGICRNQKNQYYANVCEIGYQRWGMAYDRSGIEEFKELKTEYGCIYETPEAEEPKEAVLTGKDKMNAELEGTMPYSEIIDYCEEEAINFAEEYNCFMIGARKVAKIDKNTALQYCENWGEDNGKDALYDMCLNIVEQSSQN